MTFATTADSIFVLLELSAGLDTIDPKSSVLIIIILHEYFVLKKEVLPSFCLYVFHLLPKLLWNKFPLTEVAHDTFGCVYSV